MGMRALYLDMSYTGNPDGSGVLHVSQMPPNPATFAPGPACVSSYKFILLREFLHKTTIGLFVVVKGVPSIGVPVMVGSGKIGKQDILDVSPLQSSSISSSANQGGSGPKKSSSTPNVVMSTTLSLISHLSLFRTSTSIFLLFY